MEQGFGLFYQKNTSVWSGSKYVYIWLAWILKQAQINIEADQKRMLPIKPKLNPIGFGPTRHPFKLLEMHGINGIQK